MPTELMLNFPDPTQVAVHLHIPEDEYSDMTSAFAFVNPLTDKDMEEIRWYLEDYGTGKRGQIYFSLGGWRINEYIGKK